MTEHVIDAVLEYLDRHHVMTVATCGARGPWAAAVFYVRDGTRLCFVSSPTSRHCTDLATDGRVAATIQDDHRDWPAIQGVQLAGRAAALDGADAARALSLYATKFPVVASGGAAPIAAALAKARWYALTPESLFFVDNTVAFGHRTRVL